MHISPGWCFPGNLFEPSRIVRETIGPHRDEPNKDRQTQPAVFGSGPWSLFLGVSLRFGRYFSDLTELCFFGDIYSWQEKTC